MVGEPSKVPEAPASPALLLRPQGPARPPQPRRKLREGAPHPARASRPPHTLTETREPPSCVVDALAAVSLGSTERQQPLAVTGAKRRQQPARAGAVGRAAAPGAHLPGHPPLRARSAGSGGDGAEAAGAVSRQREGHGRSGIAGTRQFLEELPGESSQVRAKQAER